MQQRKYTIFAEFQMLINIGKKNILRKFVNYKMKELHYKSF